MSSSEKSTPDQNIEWLFLTSTDSEEGECSESEGCENDISNEKKDLGNETSSERKESKNEISNERQDREDAMSSGREDSNGETFSEVEDWEEGTYDEREDSNDGLSSESEDWEDELWDEPCVNAGKHLQVGEGLTSDDHPLDESCSQGTSNENDQEFHVFDILHRECYGCFLKKCMKKLGLNYEPLEDQPLQIDIDDSVLASGIAEEMTPVDSLAEKYGKETGVEEEDKLKGEAEIEKDGSQVTGDKGKETSQGGEGEKISKDEICRPTCIVTKSQGPRIPKEEQAFVPYTFYSQHSTLTEKEHSHYVAMSLQRASGAAFVHKEDKKKFSTIKEKLTEENEKFNEEVRQLTTAIHKNRYHTLPTSIRSYVQDIFLARTQSLCRYAPRAYDRAGQYCIDSDVYTQNTPVLKFSKSLLVVGNAPSVQLPNLKRSAPIPYRNVEPISERYPANFHLEKKPISVDPNIPLLLQKYTADVVASLSSLKALLADVGPFYSAKYDIPVFIAYRKVEGILKRVIFLLKPLPSTQLSIPQLLSYVAKYALQMNLLVRPTEEDTSGSSGKRDDGSLEREEAEEGEDVLKNSATKPQNVDSQNPPEQNAKPARKKRRLCATAHLSKMMEELAGYQNVTIGAKKGGKGEQAEQNAAEFHQPEVPGRQQCYDLWTLKEFTLLVRSNSDGYMKRKDASGDEEEICKVSLAPKIEFQPEHGGEVLRAEELRAFYWNSFLKRCNLHVIVRLHYLLDQAIGVETIQPSQFLSKDIYSGRHHWISDGFIRLHWILQQLSGLDEGAYLLTRDTSALNAFSLHSESADFANADVCLLDENRKRITINLLQPQCAWLRIDPSVILQWHIIRKHAPAAFDPKETSRGITPLMSVERKLASTKSGKRKAKAFQNRRAKVRRQQNYDSDEMSPIESDFV
ncbi:hypothetical protein M514_09191 [Trichuris suis]|uniref:Little elongation complex subunit 2 C-terminal domain-containing protein n=1 Tax=Trichuris suis TaxID=68888 RepID=A0A085MZT6_9BILA|nr:hypothetical protein M514_09191 [Trichuris suis]